MFLIIGLGNPGLKYKKTRHNAGFLVIKKILKTYSLKLRTLKKSNIKFAKANIQSQDIIIATPTTYMNNSGIAVKSIASYFKIKPENIIIIHDDIDLPFDKIRIKNSGSAGGHNGVKSIIQHLGAKNFTRIKIGIGPQTDKIPSEKFVLQKFSKQEQRILQEKIIPEAIDIIREILKNNVNSAMNKYN